jgi:hypothetical protein
MTDTTTSRLDEMRRHRAIMAGEILGEAILAVSRWVSRAAHALRVGMGLRTPAHTPR